MNINLDVKTNPLLIIGLSFVLAFYSPGFASSFCLIVSIVFYGFTLFLERHSAKELKSVRDKVAELENKITVIQIGRMGR